MRANTRRLAYFSIFTILTALCIRPALAAAGEALLFDKPLGASSRALINGYAAEVLKADPATIHIAMTDLNGDGLPEFIVKNGEEYRILAENDDRIIELGAVKARDLMLGNGYVGGVRDLRVLQRPENDFDYELYVWEPRQARYIMAGQEHSNQD